MLNTHLKKTIKWQIFVANFNYYFRHSFSNSKQPSKATDKVETHKMEGVSSRSKKKRSFIINGLRRDKKRKERQL